MNIKIKNYAEHGMVDIDDCLFGVKIFDGIDKKTGNPYCEPCKGSKYVYSKTEPNIFNGVISPCESGFHFCPNFEAAIQYKGLLDLVGDKKYSKACVINPVYNVVARDKIVINSQPYRQMKFVTNNLQLIDQMSYDIIVWEIIRSAGVDEFNGSRSFNLDAIVSALFQTQGKNSEVIINNAKSYSYYIRNKTIFSWAKDYLKVVNKSKYTHYVNRYLNTEQIITPIPRYSMAIFDRGQLHKSN